MNDVATWLAGGGEMGGRIRALDWDRTATGPLSTWPQSLKSALAICLHSHFPMVIWWGRETLTQFYNDAFIPILGPGKHPQALGRCARECLPDLWPTLSTFVEDVFTSGRSVSADDCPFVLNRRLPQEEAYLSYSCSPLWDEAGAVVGIFGTVVDTTELVLERRRAKLLRAIADGTVNVGTVGEVLAQIARALTAHRLDVPFALLYSLEGEAHVARLGECIGVDAGDALSPIEIPLGQPATPSRWPLDSAIQSGQILRVRNLSQHFGAIPAGPPPATEPPTQAFVLPLTLPGQSVTPAVLIAGVSSRRELNEADQQFYEQLRRAAARPLTTVLAYEKERQRGETLLRENRDQNRVLSDAVPALISYVDPSYRYRFCNRAYTQWFGLPAEQIIGRTMEEVLGTPAWLKLQSHVDQALRGQSVRFETHAPYRTGARWIQVAYTPHFDPQSRVVGIVVMVSDITDYKRAEEALRSSEERFRAFVTSGSNVVYRMSPDWKEMRHLVGRDFIADTENPSEGWMQKYIYPEDQPKVRAGIAEAIRTKTPFRLEHRVLRRDGSLGWTDSNAIPLLDAHGEITEWIGVATDVTDRRQAVDALRESEERYRSLFESIDEGFCVIEVLFDTQQRPVDYLFIEVNPAFAKQAGLPQAVGKRIREFVSEIEPHWLENYGRVAKTGEPMRFADEYKSLGSWFDVYAFRVGAPGSHRVAVIFNNITTRKRAEIALQEGEERFRMIADNMSQLAWTCDQLGNATWYNQRWYDYTGTTFETMRGRGWELVHHPDHFQRVNASLEQARQRGLPWEETFPLRGKDGDFRWFLSRAQPIRDVAGNIVRWFGTNTDITDLRETEAKLAAANEQLASRAKHLDNLVQQRTSKLTETIGELEAFSYSISHDMRQPLRAMQQYSGILLQDFGPNLPDEARRYLHRIVSGSNRMDRLIQDVLTYSRIARAESPVELVDLNRLVVDLIEQYPGFQPDIATIEVVSPLFPVLAHETALSQALANLLGNAVKFAQPGQKPHIRIRTEPRPGETPASDAPSPAAWIRVWVEDNGIGIAPEHQDRIWNIFERAHPDGKYDGTGIGLSIVRKAAERSGGKVGVHSEPGRGSQFWLELPAAPVVADLGAGVSASPEITASRPRV
jgi:PAS domain S-box-containing protein